jgi:hypothetical protein
MTDPDLEAAWDAVHENTPDGWYAGRPGYEERHYRRSMYSSETPVVSKRSREWAAVGPTEVRWVQVMARCPGEPREGRWPR